VIGGSALWMAADKVIAKGKRIAAHLLEAADADIEFADGSFSVAGTDRRISITDVAKASFQSGRLPSGLEGGLYETGTFAPTTTPIPMAAMSVRSRSTPIPARWRSSATSLSATSARW
jgi:carbon-monoxide dehydrogenase large subunit